MSDNGGARLTLPASAVDQEDRKGAVIDVMVGCNEPSCPNRKATTRGKPKRKPNHAYYFSRCHQDGGVAYPERVRIELYITHLRKRKRDEICACAKTGMFNPQRLPIDVVQGLSSRHPLPE